MRFLIIAQQLDRRYPLMVHEILSKIRLPLQWQENEYIFNCNLKDIIACKWNFFYHIPSSYNHIVSFFWVRNFSIRKNLKVNKAFK